MSAFVSRLLVLTSAVSLALPPGWCCATASQKASLALAKDSPHSCCQHQKPAPPPGQEPAPSQPTPNCCCEKDLASPANPENANPDLTVFVTVASPDTAVAEVGGTGDANVVCPASSPPLHILQCVWRC